MANFVSPGVYTIEKDFSDYIPSINSSVVGVVGFGSKGPANEAILVTDSGQLINTFGRPDQATGGQGLWGCYNLLERTNSLYYVRAITEDALAASASIPIATPPVINVSGLSDTYEHIFFIDFFDASSNTKTTDTPYVAIVPYGTNPASALEVLENKYMGDDFEFSFERTATSSVAIVGKRAGDKEVMGMRTYATSAVAGFSAISTSHAIGGNGLPMKGPDGTFAIPLEADIIAEIQDRYAGNLSGLAAYLAPKGYSDATDQTTSGVKKIFGYPGWAVDASATIPSEYFEASTGPYDIFQVNGTVLDAIETSIPDSYKTFIAQIPWLVSADAVSFVGPAAISIGNIYSPSGEGVLVAHSLHTGQGYNYVLSSTNLGQKTFGCRAVVEGRRGKDFTVGIEVDGATAESYLMDFQTSSDLGEVSLNKVLNFNTYKNGNTSTNYYVGYSTLTGQDLSAGTLTAISKDSFEIPLIFSSTNTVASKWGNLNATRLTTTTPGTGETVELPQKFSKLGDGVYTFNGGNNGDASNYSGNTSHANVKTAIIGSSDGRTGMQAFLDDSLGVSILTIPGLSDQNIQNAAISLAESTQGFIYVFSPPVGLASIQEANNWHNGKSDSRSTSVNSSYASLVWPWVKVFNIFTGVDEYIDPAVFAVRQYTFTDAVADPWIAPAGMVRGRLTKPVDIEFVLNQGDRDALYSGGNVINPIVKFPQQGLVLFGQRTTQRSSSALDRVNVRRMMIHLRKQILAGTNRFVFEPNDPVTRRRIIEALTPMLQDIKDRRGVTAFKIICDDTVNTQARIDRNEIWCKVIVQPTKAAEIAVFEFNVTNQTGGIASVESV
jgi:phage tail sheath protein FI